MSEYQAGRRLLELWLARSSWEEFELRASVEGILGRKEYVAFKLYDLRRRHPFLFGTTAPFYLTAALTCMLPDSFFIVVCLCCMGLFAAGYVFYARHCEYIIDRIERAEREGLPEDECGDPRLP